MRRHGPLRALMVQVFFLVLGVGLIIVGAVQLQQANADIRRAWGEIVVGSGLMVVASVVLAILIWATCKARASDHSQQN